MKKSTIWMLITILVVVFVALIGVEISYMRSLITIHTNDFDGAVHRSLARVAYFLERDETQRYLDLELEERDRRMLDAQSSMRKWTLVPPSSVDADSITFDITLLANPAFYSYLTQMPEDDDLDPERKGISLEDVMTSEDLKDKYLRQKDLLNDVVLRVLHQASNRPVEQRVDFAQLQAYLDAELDMQGLSSVPYHYVVENKMGEVVYISEDFEDYYDGFEQFNYRQDLFINDPGYVYPTIYVWFPTRDQYRHTPLGIFIPTLTLSLLLLILSVLVVNSFLRQKSYSDMKSDFISNMTHELKTPVSCISLASQMLSDKDVAKSPAVIEHITNVLFNLLDNAMKYSSEERSLHLKITTSNLDDGKSLLLSIEDNGIGIAKEDLKKIFDRFFRVQKGNVHNVKGFGLGLSYVQMIIHKHRGTIAAESELGKGTTFNIILPTIKN